MEGIGAPLDRIDETVHGRVRLGVLAYLSTAGSADFMTLLDVTRATKGNLSSHLSKLEAAGYVRVDKTFVERKTRTTVQMTHDGEQAFADYLAAMRHLLNQIS
ncbi:DNA-binding MarR family transcriptional regulator [Sphingomonas sp. SORGH_AS802]|uniref:winged helix-turn-helix domain-containing protein n=1 Tax=unclassified Sphingomonas TaxID=196159 RepID=UPI00286705C1|nr:MULTISPECIES: transcriptional regulator [unclassified Sphingomonas]MDR6126728.1 DNA-binding MarR family transcriptional regulator [Sphingomonas sp. SORGH_AS_0438]MDR6134907.1 DNA-binding MarR family transcriptional regulator [Sphingomonas sp. SORGH_AS_0802]